MVLAVRISIHSNTNTSISPLRKMSKPPAKRRAKRKATDADIDAGELSAAGNSSLLASLDLSNSRTGPKTIASALLSLLPENATKQHELAQKLIKAFPLVRSELDARSIILARATQEEGDSKPIDFRFPAEGKQSNDDTLEEDVWTTISLPEDAFLPAMKFLTGRELSHFASLVSKAWLAASRNPGLWEKLDKSAGLTNSDKKINMTNLRQLLGRPQFRHLKVLAMPQKGIKLSAKSIKELSLLCPHLQLFSIGYSTSHVSGPKAKDDDLVAIVKSFPKLNAIHSHMWSITADGILTAAKIMESRLLDLRICGDTITENYLTDSSLGKIAASCPNLQHFAYKLRTSFYYNEELDRLTGTGILSLVTNCRRLEVLELENAKRVGRETFDEIIQMLARANESKKVAKAMVNEENDDSFELHKITLLGYPFVVVGDPLRLEDSSTSSNDNNGPLTAGGGRLMSRSRFIRSMSRG